MGAGAEVGAGAEAVSTIAIAGSIRARSEAGGTPAATTAAPVGAGSGTGTGFACGSPRIRSARSTEHSLASSAI